jgi:hypothetical protein
MEDMKVFTHFLLGGEPKLKKMKLIHEKEKD